MRGNLRGLAQLASAPRLGRGGRRFESSIPDHDPLTQTMTQKSFGQGFGEVLRTGLAETPLHGG